ncbi:MAG: hypothetical protein ACP5N1_02435 [Candidatus Woesearchaeota archaeon]
MNDQDKIHGIERELNTKKNDIVKNMSAFIKESKELVQKTTKEQEKAEEIIKIVRSIEKYDAVKVPDIKIIVTNAKNPSVKIKHPTNGLKFEFGKDIKLEFETEHVKTPFMYYIIGKENTASNPFPIKASRSNNAKVLINSIKENNKNPLPIGKYDIIVQILEPNNRTKILAPPDKVTIEIIPSSGAVTENKVTIISPIAAHGPYDNKPIPIKFSVKGPYHDTGKEYGYIIIVNDTKNNKEFEEYGTTKDKDVTYTHQLTNLTNGTHVIQIGILDPVASEKLISIAKETFEIKSENSPQPSLNTVTIVSPKAANSPYNASIPIQFFVAGPHHDEQKEYVYITLVTDNKNKKIFSDRGITKDKEITTAKAIEGLVDGQYNIQIAIGDPVTKKTLSTAKETFVFNSKSSPDPTKKKRGNAAYSLIVGDDIYVGGGNLSADISIDKPVLVEIQNSGTGGKLVWDSGKEDWLKITPHKGSLEAEKSERLIISLDHDKYIKAGSPKVGLVGIEGYKGNKLPKIGVVDIKKYVKNKVLGLSWIIVTVKEN